MVSKSTTFLNYITFLILYVAAFITIRIKNTEIIGFYLLLIVNAAFTLFNIAYFTGIDGMQFAPITIGFSIILSGLFHTISLIFIVMMISSLRVKYSDTYGTPINIPPIYKEKLEMFKRLTIATFSICGAMLFIYAMYYDKINVNIGEIRSIGNIIYNPLPIITLLMACAPIILSSINISIADDFTILTRQPLMR
jgi:hypothetical protein